MQETKVQSLSWEVPMEEENGNPLQYFCLGKPHGGRSLVGYSPSVAKSWIWLSDGARMHAHIYVYLSMYIKKLWGGKGDRDGEYM